MPWCSTLNQNCSGLWDQTKNMSAEHEYFAPNSTVSSFPTGKSCTHSADKEQFFFLFVVSTTKVFWIISGMYIHTSWALSWTTVAATYGTPVQKHSLSAYHPASSELQSFWPKYCLAMLCQASHSCLFTSVDSCCRG